VADQDSSRKGMRFKNMLWTRVWHNLSQMRGLWSLRVDLLVSGLTWINLTADMTTAVVQPIAAVTIPESFELTIPLDITAEDSPWNNLPCRIRSSTAIMQN
jgi:hypothetical protein